MTEAEKTHSYKKEIALTQPRVVIVGGGFGGLCAARGLAGAPVSVTLIDKRNYHLFRPMLYQVATGLLSADQISGPLRSILSRQANVEVLMDEVSGVDTQKRLVRLKQHSISYDYLILATGIQYNYCSPSCWSVRARWAWKWRAPWQRCRGWRWRMTFVTSIRARRRSSCTRRHRACFRHFPKICRRRRNVISRAWA